MADWPPELRSFESFLLGSGLVITKATKPDPTCFGNFWNEYSDDVVAVDIGYDRAWFVTVGPKGGSKHDDYDPGLLRAFLGEATVEEPVLEVELEFLTRAWNDIERSFSPSAREATCKRLDELRKDRARRLFPGLSP